VIAKVSVNTRDCWRKAAKRSASGVIPIRKIEVAILQS